MRVSPRSTKRPRPGWVTDSFGNAAVEDEFAVHVELIAAAAGAETEVIGTVGFDLELAAVQGGEHGERGTEDAAILGIEREDEVAIRMRALRSARRHQPGGDAALERDGGLHFHVGSAEAEVGDLTAGAGLAAIRSVRSQLPPAGGDAAGDVRADGNRLRQFFRQQRCAAQAFWRSLHIIRSRPSGVTFSSRGGESLMPS